VLPNFLAVLEDSLDFDDQEDSEDSEIRDSAIKGSATKDLDLVRIQMMSFPTEINRFIFQLKVLVEPMLLDSGMVPLLEIKPSEQELVSLTLGQVIKKPITEIIFPQTIKDNILNN
jgi:hypothetical protein